MIFLDCMGRWVCAVPPGKAPIWKVAERSALLWPASAGGRGDQGGVVGIGEQSEVAGKHDLLERARSPGFQVIERESGVFQAGRADRPHRQEGVGAQVLLQIFQGDSAVVASAGQCPQFAVG